MRTTIYLIFLTGLLYSTITTGANDRSPFSVWTCSPYIATGFQSRPPDTSAPLRLSLEAAMNEYENLVVNITNQTDQPQEFHITSDMPGQVGRPRSSLNVSIQQFAKHAPDKANQALVTTKLFDVKIDSIPDKENGLAMPLIELNESQTFFVPPRQTRQIWFTVLTRDLKPGKYEYSITLTLLSGERRTVAIPVDMTIWNFRLTDEAPIDVFCFDYSGDYDFLKRYKINRWFRAAFPIKLPAPKKNGTLGNYQTDIKRVIKRREEGAKKFLLSYGYAGSFIKWARDNNIPYMSDEWKMLFSSILKRMIGEWKQAGLSYDDFVLQTIDEAHGDLVQKVTETTPLIRQVDPNVKTGMTIMTDLKDLKRMAPYVDVWITRGGGLWGKEQIEFFEKERALGKPIWSWSMPCNFKSQPLKDFRTYGWRAMKFNFDGIGFFVYSGLVFDPYRSGGGFSSRHWEAWRDGVEDYQYFRLLRDLRREKRKENLVVGQPVERLIDDVLTERVFPDNTEDTHKRILKTRRQIAQEIEKQLESDSK